MNISTPISHGADAVDAAAPLPGTHRPVAFAAGAGICSAAGAWLLSQPGDALAFKAAATGVQPQYLYVQYSAVHRQGQPAGALTVQAGAAFNSGPLLLQNGGPHWLCTPLPAAATQYALRLRNGYAQVTIHALHISPLKMPLQQHPNWCWAAVLCALQHYYNHPQPLTQAQWACRVLGQGCTAQNGCSRCRQPAFIHTALGQAGYLRGVFETAITEADLQGQMRQQRPVIITQKAVHEPYGHYLLISGMHETGGYAVFDPRQPGPEIYNYAQLLLLPGRFPLHWVNTYLT